MHTGLCINDHIWDTYRGECRSVHRDVQIEVHKGFMWRLLGH